MGPILALIAPSPLVRTTRFWNNVHQICLKPNNFGARKRDRIAKIGYGYLYRVKGNLSFIKNYGYLYLVKGNLSFIKNYGYLYLVKGNLSFIKNYGYLYLVKGNLSFINNYMI